MTKRRGHGDGGIHQRSDGRWESRLDLGMVNGKRKRLSVYGKTQKAVKDQLRVKQNEREAGTLIVDQRLTLASWLDYWTGTVLPIRVSNGSLAQSTFNNYKDTVRLHLTPALGHLRLTKVAPTDVDSFIATMRSKETPKSLRRKSSESTEPIRYSANSLRLMRTTLRKAFADAEKKGLVGRNPVTLSEPVHVSRRAMKWLDQTEARALLDQVRGDRLEALYVLLLSLGLRRGEALGLRWSDVELDKGSVLIQRSLKRVQVPPLPDGTRPNGKKTELILGSLKTEDSCRTQNLPGPCVEALRKHKAEQAAEKLASTTWESSELVFTTALGSPIDPSNFAKWLSKHCVKAGLGHRNPHQLRHSVASILFAQRIDLHEVSDVMGHSSVSITKDVYGHLSADRRRAAADAVGDALWGTAAEQDDTESGDTLVVNLVVNPEDDEAQSEGAAV